MFEIIKMLLTGENIIDKETVLFKKLRPQIYGYCFSNAQGFMRLTLLLIQQIIFITIAEPTASTITRPMVCIP